MSAVTVVGYRVCPGQEFLPEKTDGGRNAGGPAQPLDDDADARARAPPRERGEHARAAAAGRRNHPPAAAAGARARPRGGSARAAAPPVARKQHAHAMRAAYPNMVPPDETAGRPFRNRVIDLWPR